MKHGAIASGTVPKELSLVKLDDKERLRLAFGLDSYLGLGVRH